MSEIIPPQTHDRQPGLEADMSPRPRAEMTRHKPPANSSAKWPSFPAIPASYPAGKAAKHGEAAPPMERPGQPDDYIFLAYEDASTMSGQGLHPNGSTVVTG